MGQQSHRIVVLLIHALGGGGAEKQLLLIASLLAINGFHAVVIPMVRRSGNGWTATLLSTLPPGVSVLRPLNEAPDGWKLMRGLGENDYLWSWGLRADVVGLGMSRLNHAKWIISSRDAVPSVKPTARLFYSAIARKPWRLIANSKAGLAMMTNLSHSFASKGRVVRNALTPLKAEWSPRMARPLTVVMIGNLRIRKKGYDVLVELAKLLENKRVDVRFRVAGRDDQGAELRSLISRNKISTIDYLGETRDVGPLIVSGDVFLLLSRYEGTPNALLEAMSTGIPCISTSVGDVGDLFQDREHLRIIPPGDPYAAADALVEIQSDFQSAIEMGRRGREKVFETFSQSAVHQDLEAAFGHPLGRSVP